MYGSLGCRKVLTFRQTIVMKLFKFFISVCLALAVFSSCKSQYDALLNSSDVDKKYAAAFDYFNNGKFQKSAQLFESLSVLTKGFPKEDTVLFYWGLSNYRYKDYYTAETNFTRFISDFPVSPFASDARYLRIDCLYRSTLRYELDQTPTRTAITAIEQYMAEYPNNLHGDVCKKMLDDLNERLDRKAYESAKLYYRMEDYLAARVAFKNVLKENSENRYREQILYYTAMSSYKYASLSIESKQKERYMTFVDDYLNFIGEIPDSEYRKQLDVYYRRAQKALGKFSGSEEELMEKNKEFEREIKKLEKS